MKGLLFSIVGPSGVGKGTICEKLAASDPNLKLSVSCTTRAPRPGERDGVNYFFIDEARYQELAASDEFLEYAGVHGKRYGTPRRFVVEQLAQGADVILEIDVQGDRQVRECMEGVIGIFIMPPSYRALKERLVFRNTEDAEHVAKRLKTARAEMRLAPEFEYCVVNDDLEQAIEVVRAIIEAERHAQRNDDGRVAQLVEAFEAEAEEDI